MKYISLCITILATFSFLAACGTLEASIVVEDTPLPEDKPVAPLSLLDAPVSAVQGLVFIQNGDFYLLMADGTQGLGSGPADGGRWELGSRYLAYLDGRHIRVLPLTGGESRSLVEIPDLPGLDVDLQWSQDGSALAYALAWDEPDGSRLVEINTSDGYRQERIAGLTARSPSPTPTIPSEPSSLVEPGFAQVEILGYDHLRGLIAVTPVGGEERYSFVQVYNTRTRSLVSYLSIEKALSQPSELSAVHDLAISPDLALLAFAYDDTSSEGSRLAIYDLDKEALNHTYTLPPGTHATSLRWSPDSRHLAFLNQEGSTLDLETSASIELDLLDLESGQVSPLPMEISAEGRILGWTEGGEAVCVVTLESINRQQRVTLLQPETGKFTSIPIPENAMALGWVGKLPDTLKTVPPTVTPALATMDTTTSEASSGRLAFISNMDGDLAIYTINADGTMLTRLTTEPMLIMHPTWSPDGKQIAFEACRGGDPSTDCPEGESFEIYTINADGSNLINLTDDPATDRFPSWSPWGEIAFSSDRSGKDEIYMINADGTGVEQISNGQTRNYEPKWSPDGKWLAYHCSDEQSTEICIQLYESSEQVIKVTGTTPVWSQLTTAGDYLLAFHCWSHAYSDICISKPDGTGVINLTNNAADDIDPSWSPDGQWIAFQSNMYSDISIYKVCTTCEENIGPIRLTGGESFANWPMWSPDGNWIAYLLDNDLYVMLADGSGQKLLAGDVHGPPAWQP